MPRQPNRRPKIYEGADGWWHCYLTVGKKPNGKLDRRHIRGRTATEVAEKIRALEAKLARGHVPEVGQRATVADWLEHWVTVIAPRRCRPSTVQGYEYYIRKRLIPGLGRHRLDKLTAELVEAHFLDMEQQVAPATALQAYRILARAMKVAHQRGKIGHNPVALVDPPSTSREESLPPTVKETRAILEDAGRRRNAARWWIALGLGLRQGEALGLRWQWVDLDGKAPLLRVEKALGRRKWRHGCDDQVACAKPKCRTKACPPKYEHGCEDPSGCKKLAHWCPSRHKVAGCSTHRSTRGCPPLCSPGCRRHAARCPQRKGGGIYLDDPKSKKSKRPIPLPEVIANLLREHRQAQRRERMAAAVWHDHDLVFCQANGKPLQPRADWEEWTGILREAGSEHYRLHAARHGAATTWQAAGIDARVAMELLGHSQISLTQNLYTHVRPEILAAAAERIGGALELLQPQRATTRRRRKA
jgi:integrase